MTGFLSAQAGIHAQHVQNATSRIDPRLRGDDNNSTYLQDDAVADSSLCSEKRDESYFLSSVC